MKALSEFVGADMSDVDRYVLKQGSTMVGKLCTCCTLWEPQLRPCNVPEHAEQKCSSSLIPREDGRCEDLKSHIILRFISRTVCQRHECFKSQQRLSTL